MEEQNQPAKQADNPNLSIYNQLRAVPKQAQKDFSNGSFSGTDINPMWRIKRMTEIFGPVGFGWYYEVVHRTTERSTDDKNLCMFIGINLFVKHPETQEWSKPIYGEGGNTMTQYVEKSQKFKTSDEAFKMALTDAISNATKQLGLGANIWFENDVKHSTKYDQQMENAREQTAPAPAPKLTEEQIDQAVKEMQDTKSPAEASVIFNKYPSLQTNTKFKQAIMDKQKQFAQPQQQPQQQPQPQSQPAA